MPEELVDVILADDACHHRFWLPGTQAVLCALALMGKREAHESLVKTGSVSMPSSFHPG